MNFYQGRYRGLSNLYIERDYSYIKQFMVCHCTDVTEHTASAQPMRVLLPSQVPHKPTSSSGYFRFPVWRKWPQGTLKTRGNFRKHVFHFITQTFGKEKLYKDVYFFIFFFCRMKVNFHGFLFTSPRTRQMRETFSFPEIVLSNWGEKV